MLLLTTGGTIAMNGAEVVNDFLRHLHLGRGVVVDDYASIASCAVDTQWLKEMADHIVKNHNEHRNIVITHGTDTLEDTAYYLSLVLPKDKTVILTGAMRQKNHNGYDGIKNIQDAFSAINYLQPGVYVCFNGELHCAEWVEKVETTGYNAFGSCHRGIFGKVEGDCCYKSFSEYYAPKREVPYKNTPEGKVFIVRSSPGIDREIVCNAMEQADIVIIEGYGGGRVPQQLVEEIERQAQQKPVWITTRVPSRHCFDEYGYPGSYKYFKDKKIPVIYCNLSASKAALLGQLDYGDRSEYFKKP